MTRTTAFLLLAINMLSSARADLVTFEELTVFTATGATGSYYNGNSGMGSNSNGWSSGGVFFNNTFDTSFGGIWSGWSYSNVVDSTTAGFNNQYASSPGGGANGSGGVTAGGKYAVAFGFAPNIAFINLPTASQLQSVEVTNSTYAALSMANGDAFSKKFGGASGNDPDFFRVTFTGYDALNATGISVGSVTVDLADFTFSNNALDFIRRNWLTVDLSPIASARSIGVSFASSDSGQFGINTPTYFALDNLSFLPVPEPSSLLFLMVAGACSVVARSRMRRSG